MKLDRSLFSFFFFYVKSQEVIPNLTWADEDIIFGSLPTSIFSRFTENLITRI